MKFNVEFNGNGKYSLIVDNMNEGPLEHNEAVDQASQLLNAAAELLWAYGEIDLSLDCDKIVDSIDKNKQEKNV